VQKHVIGKKVNLTILLEEEMFKDYFKKNSDYSEIN
jgi:hypothetical protein